MHIRSAKARQAIDAPASLLRKLESLGEVSIENRQALSRLDHRVRHLAHGEDVLREGEQAKECCLLIDGLMHRYKVLTSGKRQILGFHTPGEIPDLFSLHLTRADHNLASVVPSTVALISHSDLHKFLRLYPEVRDLLWRDALLQAAISHMWIVGLGRRSARGRVAHLFCEMCCRLAAIGLSDGTRFPLPLTQAELGDALGLTPVHINRTIQELRRDGLLRLEGGYLTIRDWDRLTGTAGFDPAYLNVAPGLADKSPLLGPKRTRFIDAERLSDLAPHAT